ncbi:MAG: hypothetical protein EPN26_03975 [Rhodospirillales bacterium]|nr:MAG: hypothetical protein EPN26_03975 [Rhodospirillales bacterium]
MRRILLACVFFVVPCAGNASSVKEDIAALENERTESKSWLATADRWLQFNDDVFYQGTCHSPYQPSSLCSTRQEARERAIVSCGFKWKGCEGVATLLNGKGDAPVLKYLANVGCNSVAADLRGESYTEGDLALDTLDALAESFCSGSDDFISKAACLYSKISAAGKQFSLVACIKEETDSCVENYSNWKTASEKYDKCNAVVGRVRRERASVQRIDNEIEKLKNGFSYKYLGGKW